MFGKTIDSKAGAILGDTGIMDTVIKAIYRVAEVAQPINLSGALKIEVINVIITVIGAAADYLVTQRLAVMKDRRVESIERAVEIEHHATPDTAYGL